MNRHVLVALFESVVLLDVVQVVSSDDNSPVHLHLGDDTGQNAATDGHVASEGTFLVNVGTFASLNL